MPTAATPETVRDLDDLDLPWVDLNGPAYLADPHGTWRDLRAQSWLVRSDMGVHVLPFQANHDLVRSRALAAMGDALLQVQGISSGTLYDYWTQGLLFAIEGERHDRLRALQHKAFTPRMVDRLRPAMREIAGRLVSTFADRGSADFATEFASRYPLEVIAQVLGIPVADTDIFEQWSTDIGLAGSFPVAPVQDRVEAAISSLFDYAGELIALRHNHPGDDLISALIAMQSGDDRLTSLELQWTVVNLTFGGHDTTRNQLAYLLLSFCEHPDQWRRVAADPTCAAGAVEEGMRLRPAIPATARMVGESFTYGSVRFPAGTVLMLQADCANRDPDVFPDPERFDISRDNAARQVTFGGGLHTCLGVYLARTEMAEALPLLARAMPDVRLDGPGRWRPNSNFILGPESMPVRFSAVGAGRRPEAVAAGSPSTAPGSAGGPGSVDR